MDWENLRFFLAVAREGTLAGAGRSLNVKHSTVLRRVAQFEEELGLKLFERHPTGYMLTTVGREVMETALRVDGELVAIERKLSGQDLRLTGTVRLASFGMLVPWISQALADFRKLYPGILVEVAISPTIVSLSKHEADIAIRLSRNPPKSLVGRRIATLAHGIYAAATHPAALADKDGNLFAHEWLAYSGGRSELPQSQWIASNVPAERVVFTTNHTGMLVAAARSGLGLALLPCYVGDSEPRLKKLSAIPSLKQEMWILTHGDLRRTPRVRALMDFLCDRFSQLRDLIEGRGGIEQTD